MFHDVRSCLMLAALLASSTLETTTETVTEDCGDIQHNVENGMIRLPDFSAESIKDINCSWTYVAPQGRQLLVKVDSVHLPPSELRVSLFQLYIDDQIYDIPRNCVKCLKDVVGGKTIKVLFSSSAALASENKTSLNYTEGIGSFQVRYKSFDPHRCGKPDQTENGHVIIKGRKVGQTIFYICNPPYDLFGDAESQCAVSNESPVPEWSNQAPKCAIQDCSNGPITRESSSGAIASPGYPNYLHQFSSSSPCVWVIQSQFNQQIKVSITYLKLPQQYTFSENSSRLALIDGDSTYIVNLTESIASTPLNFTTLTNKLIVQFIVDADQSEETGFYLDYSTVSNSCPKPETPDYGDVIGYSTDLGSILTYKCDYGYVLVGELHSECLLNGQWSHSAPTCESVSIDSSYLLATSNDSDTVTAKLSQLPIETDSTRPDPPPKPSRNGKKKTKEPSSSKVSDTVDIKRKESEHSVPETTDAEKRTKNGRKHDKENGPKSEPHLLQVIPPKVSGKKSDYEDTADFGWGPRSGNMTKAEEFLPALETGLNDENDRKSRHPFFSVTMISIIAGVGVPAFLGVIIVIAILVYRRRYPVRMRFGRKFSTFENPMYVSKDAQHPRELKRLTT